MTAFAASPTNAAPVGAGVAGLAKESQRVSPVEAVHYTRYRHRHGWNRSWKRGYGQRCYRRCYGVGALRYCKRKCRW